MNHLLSANPDVQRELHRQLALLSPRAFELFAGDLLVYVGLENVAVTRYIGDAGIDAEGDLIAGAFRFPVGVQVKRYRKNVQRADIDRFIGALTGRFVQGIFVTTADFSAGALLVLSALVRALTVTPAGDGDLREASLEFALLMTPLLLGPLVLALARRGTHAANRVLVGSGLLGSLTVVIVFAVLLPLLGTAAYAAFPWLLLGVGVWLVGSNWPALWDRPLPQRVLACCGVITGAGLCLLMGSIGLAPLVPSPANAPTWILSLLNGMFIAIGITFVVWAVGTGLRLVLPPRATGGR
jgi:hypothetical protein